MFSTPEIYLKAELQYHRDHVRGSFRRGRLERHGQPLRRRSSSRLARWATTAASASR